MKTSIKNTRKINNVIILNTPLNPLNPILNRTRKNMNQHSLSWPSVQRWWPQWCLAVSRVYEPIQLSKLYEIMSSPDNSTIRRLIWANLPWLTTFNPYFWRWSRLNSPLNPMNFPLNQPVLCFKLLLLLPRSARWVAHWAGGRVQRWDGGNAGAPTAAAFDDPKGGGFAVFLGGTRGRQGVGSHKVRPANSWFNLMWLKQ